MQIAEIPVEAVQATATPVDGIDLDASMLNLQIMRDGKGVALPTMQQPIQNLRNIQGFFPVILNVGPANVPLILGAADQKESEPDQLTFNLSLGPVDQKQRFNLN